jgi:hypothetical protein
MAGLEVRFRFGAIKDLASNIPDIVPAVDARLDAIGLEMADKGVDMIRSRMRVSSGRGQRSVTSKVTGRQFAFGSPLIHVRVMDKGRAPGAKMPPKGALLPWMRRKGIDARDEFPIRRAIGTRGIPGDHQFAQVRNELKPEVESKMGEVKADIISAMVESITLGSQE